jgi:hypothetical protein
MSFYKAPTNEFDPLDLEILERAFDASWEALRTSRQHNEAETDEELEAALRRELIEIVRANGVSDPEALMKYPFDQNSIIALNAQSPSGMS